MAATFRDALPRVYRHVLPELFDREAPVETMATCDDCAMTGAEREHENVTFLAEVKCCTFHPQIPNYLVGALLADPDPALSAGRDRMRRRIASRSRITPRWVAPSRRDRAIYRSARHAAFGRSEMLLCPYFEEGSCTVWPYRESSCSTFFCKHVGGEDGRHLWRSVSDYLAAVEKRLAAHLATVVGPDVVEPDPHMTLEELEEKQPTDSDYRHWWGTWVDREEAFYIACANALSSMTQDDLVTLMAPVDKRRLPLLGQAYESFDSTAVADTLQLAPDVRIDSIANGTEARVTGYSEYDPLRLPAATAQRLATWTEPTPVTELLTQVDGDRALLKRLQRSRILVSPDEVTR